MAKVVTGKVRLSYVNIINPKAVNDGDDPKYSVCVLVPKSDEKTLKKISKAVEEVKKEGKGLWGNKIPGGLHLPLRDGDEERADEQPEFEGMMFFNATTKRKPGVVDKDREEILDLSEVYSGCYGRVSINFYPYSVSGNKGIAAGLNNIQKLADGPRLGSAISTPEEDFDDDFEDDDEELL